MSNNAGVDIHNYDENLLKQIEVVKNAPISEANRKLLFKFDEYMTITERLSTARRLRCFGIGRMIAEKYLKVDFNKAKLNDIRAAIAKIENNSDYSAWTKASYRSYFKKFYRWLRYGDDKTKGYPPEVSWILGRPKRSEIQRKAASDMLTQDELNQLIDAADSTRDKAFISILYESCGRIGEIGGTKIKDISTDANGFIIDVRRSKTEQRPIFIIKSAPLLTAWLSIHPKKDDPNAPLWITTAKYSSREIPQDGMRYGALRSIIRRIAEKTGIKKRIHPHLFRHTRTTDLLRDGVPEAITKKLRGDTANSTIIGEYSHLISDDVKSYIYKHNGIETKETTGKQHMVKCPRCDKVNAPERDFCYKCWLPLNEKAAIVQQDLAMRGERLRTAYTEQKEDRIERLEREILELKQKSRRR